MEKNLIGQSAKRIDAFEKVTGKALYVGDLKATFSKALVIKALRSPYAHAKINKLNCESAKCVPGVELILTADDNRVDWNAIMPISRLAADETLWAGQAVAYVAAVNEESADEALSKIQIEYTKLPHVITWKEALQEQPVSIVDPELGRTCKDPQGIFISPNAVGFYHLNKGDVDNAFLRADVIVEDYFSTGKKSHAQLERAMAITEYHSDGSMTLYCNSCGVHTVVKSVLCSALHIPSSKLRVVQLYTGGSFGNRNIAYVEIITTLIAMLTKRTVRMEFSRSEMFCATPTNWSCTTHIKLGALKDGTIIAKQVELFEEIGASVGNKSYTGRLSSSALTSVYSIENVRMDTCAVLTNTVPAGAYRGLGAPEAAFGFETLISRLAAKLKIDPVQLRLKNIIKKGGTNDYGEEITSIGIDKCLSSVAEAIDLHAPLGYNHNSDWKIGRGVACAGKQNAPAGRAEAKVQIHHDGSVELYVSCDNHGMGASTVMLQIAADTLGVPMDKIKLHIGDTNLTPYDNFSASSRAVYATGNAVRFACENALEQLRTAAAREVGVHPSMVSIKGDKAYITGASIKEISICELFRPLDPFKQNNWGLLKGTPIEGFGRFSPAPIKAWSIDGCTPRMWNWYQYSAAAVKIAVNEKTGQIVLLKVANAADSGNPINPALVESQIDGGTVMSAGFFIQEEIIYDANGRTVNDNFGDYRVPTTQSCPMCADAMACICPDPLPDGPFGAKGMSESVVVPLGPAINAALIEALGIHMNYYPMTAERVLAAIRKKEMSSG